MFAQIPGSYVHNAPAMGLKVAKAHTSVLTINSVLHLAVQYTHGQHSRHMFLNCSYFQRHLSSAFLILKYCINMEVAIPDMVQAKLRIQYMALATCYRHIHE